MKKILRDLLTGKDNTTHDVVRWLAVLSVIVALGLSIYTVVVKDASFDLMAYGLGIGAVFASVGAALKMKETTEPESKEKEET